MPHERSESLSSYSSYSSSSGTSEPRSRLRNAVAKQIAGGTAVKAKKQKPTPQPGSPRTNAQTPAVTQSQVDEIDNLREMLVDRRKELAEEKDPARKKDIQKDLEILKQWLQDKEQKTQKGKAKAAKTAANDVVKAKSDSSARQRSEAKAALKDDKKHNKVAKKDDKKPSKPEKKQKEQPGAEEASEPPAEPKVKVPSRQAGKTSSDKKARESADNEGAEKVAAKRARFVADAEQTAVGAPVWTDGQTADKATGKKSDSPMSRADAQVPSQHDKMKPDVAAGVVRRLTDDASEVKSQPETDRQLPNADMILQAKEALQQSLNQQKVEATLSSPTAPAGTVCLGASATAVQDGQQQFVLASEVTTLMPSEKVPPCELPLWCVMPNPRDIEVVLEIVRHVPGSSVPSKRVRLGRRAWALLGRRLHEAQAAEAKRAGVPEPDIGLACPLSSKAHALVLQNWTGKIFLKDLGSAHGTFLGGVRLNPHEPFEWPAGIQAYFADAGKEFFELRSA